MQQALIKAANECEAHNGVSELLEVLGGIVTGLALPLKHEHRALLKALLPLTKLNGLPIFYKQLSYCVTQFVKKDPRLAPGVVMSMLECNTTFTPTHVLFIHQLNLDMADGAQQQVS